MPAGSTVYFVSGANRGLGFGLVTALCSRPNAIVFAGARDLSTADELNALATDSNGRLHIVKLVSGSVEDATAAAKIVQEKAGKLDVLIANAGMLKYFGTAITTPLSELRDHFEVNTIGPIVLFQACAPVLFKSSAPQFVGISSDASRMNSNATPGPLTAYGLSKVGLNFFAVKLHQEQAEQNLAAYALHPGFLQTEMGNGAARFFDLEQATETIDQGVSGVLGNIDGATRESRGGRIWGAIKAEELAF